MSVVDDFGRYHADPTLLLSDCFPLRPPWADENSMNLWLGECKNAGLIQLYAVSGTKYLEIDNFGQRLRKGARSRFPPGAADGGESRRNSALGGSRASSPSPSTPPFVVSSEGGVGETRTRAMQLVPDTAVVESEFQLLATIFLGLGAALSETDMRKCAMLWISLDVAAQLGALDYARKQRDGEWHTCELRYVPRLWNYLEGRHWERRAVVDGRKRAMTKGEETNERVARRFMASERTK